MIGVVNANVEDKRGLVELGAGDRNNLIADVVDVAPEVDAHTFTAVSQPVSTATI